MTLAIGDDQVDFLPEIHYMLLGFRLLGFELRSVERSVGMIIAQTTWKVFIGIILGLMLLVRTCCTGMVIIGPYYDIDELANFEEKCAWSALVLINIITFWAYVEACFRLEKVVELFLKLGREVSTIATSEAGIQMKGTIRTWAWAVFLCPIAISVILFFLICMYDFSNKAFMAKVIDQLTDDFETGKFTYHVCYYVNIFGMVLMFMVRTFLGTLFLCLCHISRVFFVQLTIEDPDKPRQLAQANNPSINLTVYLRRHHSLCEMVCQMNDYMSNLLLVTILGESIFVILYTLIIVNGEMQADLLAWILQAIFWVFEMTVLFLVTILVARVNEQIIGSLISDSIISQCQKQHVENVHMKYHLYITQVRAMSIGISCGGVFLLCKSSIFTIAGTIVTYYLIIDQMK